MKRMHENSLEAYHNHQPELSNRAALVLDWFSRNGMATDRKCMAGLGFTDPNKVRPRITELIEQGSLIEVGKVTENGRRVRQVKLPIMQLGLFS